MYVKERFKLNEYTKELLQDMEPNFGYNGFGEFLYYRTYSRNINVKQECWADTVIRVIEGTFSIRKDWYIKNYISWNEEYWQKYAEGMAIYLFNLYWSPAGRGLWVMGTQFIYERGAMALYSCAYTEIHKEIVDDLCWATDCLMLGVGVGFSPIRQDDIKFKNPHGSFEHVITDSREGWVQSIYELINSYRYGSSKPKFIYDEIRSQGAVIKGFGGYASGPDPLKYFHQQIEENVDLYMTDKYYDSVILKTDLMNQSGVMVIAGNSRRSAEIGKLSIKDPVFKDLKDYKKYPRRAEWGYMSNNSVDLEYDEDFEQLDEIAKRVIENGEPGYCNLQNFPYGRIGKNDKIRKDKATGINPCLSKDTKICLADGKGFIPIQDIIDKDVDVYCLNDKDEICIRRMRNPRITGYKEKILKVIFDDGNFVRVTSNHKFMLRNRSFKEAKNLREGDSLAVMKRYIPENCSRQSYWDKYISIGYSGNVVGEHKLIAEYNFNYIGDDHIHHKNGDRLNNNPNNLEIKDVFEHLSDHSIGEQNANWSEYTNQELINFGINLAKKLGRRFSINEWRKLELIKSFSEYRKKELGSFEEFAYYCAELAEVINDPVDTRILRTYLEMVDQGYETEIFDNQVLVTKICEGCKQEFKIDFKRREQASCSFSCNNIIRDYSKNIEGQRKTFAARKETLKEAQLEIYCKLKNILKRTPLKREWVQGCKDANISAEICRKSSPFLSWSDLKYKAKDFNHRVLMVLEDGEEDVYNGTVDEFHNFIIGGWEYYTPFGRKVQSGVITSQCGESILENREVCNQAETFPTMCPTTEDWYKSCEYATFYTSTVSLLPTHQPSTNRVVARNRRITVSLVDFPGWIHEEGVSIVTKYLRKGYKIVCKTNRNVNAEAGVPEAIRKTTMKPGGTVPKLAGKNNNYPNFEYMIRRVKVGRGTPVHKLLVEAHVPYEADYLSQNTDVFEWPIHNESVPIIEEISIWNQAMNLVLLQREWSDNAVSITLNFRPKWKLIKRFSILEGCNNPFEYTKQWLLKNLEHNLYNKFMDDFALYFEELQHDNYKIKVKLNNKLKAEEINIYQYDPTHEEDSIEPLLAAIAPLTKSVSIMPHTAKGVYHQIPEEGISKQEYELRLSRIKKINWSKLNNSEGDIETDKFCTGDQCQL